jgi:hypothetical protein
MMTTTEKLTLASPYIYIMMWIISSLMSALLIGICPVTIGIAIGGAVFGVLAVLCINVIAIFLGNEDD